MNAAMSCYEAVLSCTVPFMAGMGIALTYYREARFSAKRGEGKACRLISGRLDSWARVSGNGTDWHASQAQGRLARGMLYEKARERDSNPPGLAALGAH